MKQAARVYLTLLFFLSLKMGCIWAMEEREHEPTSTNAMKNCLIAVLSSISEVDSEEERVDAHAFSMGTESGLAFGDVATTYVIEKIIPLIEVRFSGISQVAESIVNFYQDILETLDDQDSDLKEEIKSHALKWKAVSNFCNFLFPNIRNAYTLSDLLKQIEKDIRTQKNFDTTSTQAGLISLLKCSTEVERCCAQIMFLMLRPRAEELAKDHYLAMLPDALPILTPSLLVPIHRETARYLVKMLFPVFSPFSNKPISDIAMLEKTYPYLRSLLLKRPSESIDTPAIRLVDFIAQWIHKLANIARFLLKEIQNVPPQERTPDLTELEKSVQGDVSRWQSLGQLASMAHGTDYTMFIFHEICTYMAREYDIADGTGRKAQLLQAYDKKNGKEKDGFYQSINEGFKILLATIRSYADSFQKKMQSYFDNQQCVQEQKPLPLSKNAKRRRERKRDTQMLMPLPVTSDLIASAVTPRSLITQTGSLTEIAPGHVSQEVQENEQQAETGKRRRRRRHKPQSQVEWEKAVAEERTKKEESEKQNLELIGAAHRAEEEKRRQRNERRRQQSSQTLQALSPEERNRFFSYLQYQGYTNDDIFQAILNPGREGGPRVTQDDLDACFNKLCNHLRKFLDKANIGSTENRDLFVTGIRTDLLGTRHNLHNTGEGENLPINYIINRRGPLIYAGLLSIDSMAKGSKNNREAVKKYVKRMMVNNQQP